MLHACVQNFDVTGNLEKFWELNSAAIVGVMFVCVEDVFGITFS